MFEISGIIMKISLVVSFVGLISVALFYANKANGNSRHMQVFSSERSESLDRLMKDARGYCDSGHHEHAYRILLTSSDMPPPHDFSKEQAFEVADMLESIENIVGSKRAKEIVDGK